MEAHFENEELSDETSEERSYPSCGTGVQSVSVPYLKNKKLRSPPPDIGTSSESLNDDVDRTTIVRTGHGNTINLHRNITGDSAHQTGDSANQTGGSANQTGNSENQTGANNTFNTDQNTINRLLPNDTPLVTINVQEPQNINNPDFEAEQY